jgi:nucleoside-diphosphate-sugar epimerase
MIARVAVTGATGFIGHHVVARLAARGTQVTAIVRPDSPRPAPHGAAVERVPLRVNPLVGAFRGAEAIVHLAGVISAADPRAYFDVNVGGTRAVADAAQQSGAHLIHISSLAAAGPAPGRAPRTETDANQPINDYGRSKLEGEHAVASTNGLKWTILRPGVVYGPGDRATLPLFRLARLGVLPDLGRADAAYTFVYIDDLLDAIEGAIAAPPDQLIVFVGHPTPVTMPALAAALGGALGRRVRRVRVPRTAAIVAAGIGDFTTRLTGWDCPVNRRRLDEMSQDGFVCLVDRLRDRLGVVARVDLDDGTQRALAWYRRARWLT